MASFYPTNSQTVSITNLSVNLFQNLDDARQELLNRGYEILDRALLKGFEVVGMVPLHSDAPTSTISDAYPRSRLAVLSSASDATNVLFYTKGVFVPWEKEEAILFDCYEQHAVFCKNGGTLIFDIYPVIPQKIGAYTISTIGT